MNKYFALRKANRMRTRLLTEKSTLYPLLLRLEQQGKVTVERRPSPKGPSRKYYVVTEEGRQALLEFRQDWSQLCQLVEKIFKEEPDE